MATKKRNSPLLKDSGIDWNSPVGEPILTAPTQPAAEDAPPDGAMRRYVGDTALSVGRGAVQGVRMLTDIAGADNAVSGGLRSVEDFIGGLQSATAKRDQAEIARLLAEAEGKGVLDQVVAGLKAFGTAPLQTMAQAAGTSLPTIAAALIPGAGPVAMATRFAAPLALGAAQGAGAVKSSIYDEVKQRALKEGRTPAEAEQLAAQAQSYGGDNAGQIALGAGLGAWAGKSGLEGAAQRLIHGGGGQAASGMASRVAMGALAEGIPEAAQGGQEKFASNSALNNAGFPTDPMSGVIANATMEGLAGHAMGGAMGIPRPGDAIRETMLPEGGPMTRAANAATKAQARAADAGMAPLKFTPTELPAGESGELKLSDKPDDTALDFEADPRFAGAKTFGNGAAPNQPMFASKSLADIHIGEQGAMGELEAVEAAPGQWTVKQTDEAANRLARANIEQWMAKAQPMPEERARSMAKDADSQLGKKMTALPMPDGSGWTVVPTQWVSAPILMDYVEHAAAAEQANAEREARAKEAGESAVVRAPRTPSANAVEIDPKAPNAVAQFIAAQAATNTMSARAFVQDYRAGRITDADVLERINPKKASEPSADERIAAAAAQAPKPAPTDGLILNPKGEPFKTELAANRAQKKAGTGAVLQVAGGWVVRPGATTVEPSNAQDQATRVPPAAAPAPVQEGADSAGPGTPAAPAAGAAGPTGAAAPAVEGAGLTTKQSSQFADYKYAIEQADTVGGGMLDQIRVDERLEDGEAEQLLALAQPKTRAGKAEPTQKKPPFVSKEDGEHLFGIPQKRAKALERIAKGSAYFGAKDKANDFITGNGLKETHEAFEAKPGRFEVRAKGSQQAAPENAISRRNRLKAEREAKDAPADGMQKALAELHFVVSTKYDQKAGKYAPVDQLRFNAAVRTAKASGIEVSTQVGSSGTVVWSFTTPAGDGYSAYLEKSGKGTWMAQKRAPEAAQKPAPAAPSANTLVTEDAAEKARAIIKAKLRGNTLNSGIDPELLQAGITLAAYHVERGARKFAAYARAMVDDLGDVVKPYLQSWYMAMRSDPTYAAMRADMDKASAVEDLDVDEVLAGGAAATPNAPAPAEGPGSDAGNGFKQGPKAGERYRVGVVASVGGAVLLEKRLPAGTAATFYIGKDGNLIDGDSVNFIGDGKERLWIPATPEQAQQAQAILDEMGRLELNDPARKDAKARLKALVQGKPTQEPNEAARPQAQAAAGESAAPAAAPAPAAPAVVPGTTSGAVEADGVKQPDRVKVMTRQGQNVYVERADLEGDKPRMRHFTSTGKSLGLIVRENLDPTGELRRADAKEAAENPLFDAIGTKDGRVFASEAAAARELSQRGLKDTHEVAPEGNGFIVKRRAPEAAPQPTGGEAAPAPAPEAAPVELPRLPVDAYRVERRYANGAVIRPLPGKSFTDGEVRQIANWFRAAKWEVSTAAPSGVSAVNNANMSADDIPEPYTAAQRKKDERRRDADAATAAKTAAQDDYLTGTAAGEYVAATFGDTLNKFNSVALAKFLAGEASTFEGLMNARAADVVQGMGIAVAGRATKDVLADLKARFAGQAAPTPERTPKAQGVAKQAQPQVTRFVTKSDMVGSTVEWQEQQASGDWMRLTTFDTMQQAKDAAASRGYDAEAIPRFVSEFSASAKRFLQAVPEAAPAERTPKAQAVKEALAGRKADATALADAWTAMTPEARASSLQAADVDLNTPTGRASVEAKRLAAMPWQSLPDALRAKLAPIVALRVPKDAQPAAAATHKDPGEPAEPVTPAVVREAIKTAADNRDRPIKDVKADALRLIDEAMPNAKPADDMDVQMYEATAPGVKMTAAQQAEYKRLSGNARDKYMERLANELAAQHQRAADNIGYVTIKVPGDGVFKVLNTAARLAEFRKKAEASPGFKAQRPGPIESDRVRGNSGRYNDRAGERFGVESGSGSKLAAFDNMVNEGDLEAASDYADAVGLELDPKKLANATKVLKWRETRTTDPAPEPAAEAPAAAPAPTDRRRKAAEYVRQAVTKRTNANSAMVWQIIGPDGEAVSGPPGKYPGNDGPLAGSATMGNLGWGTKREAEAALAELNRKADEILGAAGAAPAPAADDRVLTIENGGSTQTLTLPKPAWQATDDELVQAVKDSGAYLGEPGSKYDPYRQWREAHSEAITKAAREGKTFPDELLYDKPALIRADLSDDQADEASDAMVAEYRATKDYGKAVAVYREWGKQKAAPADQAAAILNAAAEPPKGKERLDVLKDVKAGAITPEEVAAAFPPAPITDVGEKIGGARKDMAESGGTRSKRGTTDDRPAWARRFEISQIVTPGGMVGEVKDAGRWIIRDARNLDWMKQPRQVGRSTYATKEEAEAQVPLAAVALKHRVVLARSAAPKTEADVDATLKADMAAKAADDERPGKIEYGLMQTARKRLAAGSMTQANFNILQEKYGAAAAQYTPPAEPAVKAPTGEKYEIWRDITDRKRVKVVDQQFDSREEAMAYMMANAVQIVEANTTFGEADLPLPPDRARTGPERRTGNVTADDFKATFGFRGVQFGNWNSQDERQALMNDAWDGLMDLADVLGLPPKALGLNGDLALAFGARGHGLNSARAHYEPARTVINLTKEQGAGSLAHEWFHALDHYFGRQDGKASATWKVGQDGTRTLDVSGDGAEMVSSGFRGERSGVRKGLRNAYDAMLRTMTKKAETYVEDTAKADKWTGVAREELAQALASLRRELAEQKDVRYYKRNNKPASAELLAEFDAIAKQMLDGEVSVLATDWKTFVKGGDKPANARGASIAIRWTNDSLERLSAIHKEVRGRSGFDGTNKQGVLDRLRGNMERYSQRLKMLADAQGEVGKVRAVPTDFAMNARDLDQGRGTDYWTTPHEMAARAFQGYVEDKIAERGGMSRFLNYAPENAAILTPWGFKRPYPAGEERKAINDALDKFISALETRADDAGNVAMFSRAEAQQQPASDRRQAVEALVQQIASRWGNAPVVVVVDSMEDERVPKAVRDYEKAQQSKGASGAPEGFFFGGKVYLVAGQLGGDADVLRVLFHEALGHFGLRGTFGPELGTILDRLAVLNAAKVRAKAKQYGLDYDKPSDRRAAAEEVLAEMAQRTPDIGWGKKAIAAIRTWLRLHAPGFRKMALSDAELVRSYILPARAFVQRGGPNGGPGGGMQFSRGPLSKREKERYEQLLTDPFLEGRKETKQEMAELSRLRDKLAKHEDAQDRQAEGSQAAFSRSIGDAVRDFSQQGARNAFMDAVTSHGSTNLWTRTVGTQYHKAKTNPTTFGPVFNAVQDYIKETSVFANQAADLAPSLLPKLDSWRDLVKDGITRHGADPVDTAKAGEAIFQGTLNKEKYDDATLARRFGLSEKQIGLYHEFRAAVDESLTGMVKSEILRLAGDEGRPARAAVLRAATARQAADVMAGHLADMAEETGDTGLLDQVDAIGQKVDRIEQLQAEGYAPLMRFGKHTLTITARDGSVAYFGMYESVRDANKAARLLGEDPEFSGATFTQGVMSQEGHKLFSGMSLDALELFADATGNADNEVYQQYLKLALANRSAMKRMIERKGTKGYSDDVARVLASFVTSNARAAAGNLHLTGAKKAAEAIPKEQGDLRDDAINLVEYVTNPAEEAAAVRGLLFTTFIGGSVASALVNITQPITMTLPYLTQFGGAGKAAKRLLAAAAMVATGKVTGDMAAALRRAEADGIVSPQEIHHLQAEAMNSMGQNPYLKKAAFVWGSMFSLAEQFNRRVSFVAAYQTATEQGIANPFAFAEQAVVETQGLYNKGNKANWARGAVGATVMTFKQFSTHYLEFLTRMAKNGPEGRKAVAVALAILLLTAGAGGLPFADDLDDLIDTLGQAMGHDTNSKRWKRQFIAQTLGLGDTAAEVATRGLSSLPGMPIDLSLRMGMGNLLPATGLMLRSNTDTARQLLEVAGAGGGLLANVKDGATKALGGDVVGGTMTAMPVAIQNIAKAIQMWDTGEYRDKKGRKVMDVDAVDGAAKFLGFQPAAVARESSRVGETMRTVQLAKNVEAEIAGKWAQAMADGDKEAVAKARQELADWNAANPQAPIKITLPQVLRRLKELKTSRADRATKAAPKELRPLVREVLH